MVLRTALFASLIVVSAPRLPSQAVPEFEVATIRPAAPSSDGRTHIRMSSDTDKGQLNYTNVNVKEVMGKAYAVQQYQISGPGIDTDRFDIVARFPAKTSGEQVPLMLQALLKERFHLTFHRETKDLPMYALTVAKNGPKVTPVETATGITSNSNRSRWHIVAKISMRSFAEFLSTQAGRPVIDKTGLTGTYEI